MGRCYLCGKPATKVVVRQGTGEERKETIHRNEEGFAFVGLIKREVCDEHLKEAQKVYPEISNEEPS